MATYLTWRWIFFINIPIGLAGIALVTRFIGPLGEQRPGPLDLIGFITSGLALTGLMIGLELAGHPEIDARLTLSLLISGSLIAVLALRHSLHRPAPLIDIRLFRIPTFAICVGAGSLFRLGVGAFPYLLPLLLQIGFGMTAFGSGLLTFASGSGALVMKLCARRVLARWGFRPILVVNGLGAAAYLSVCALLSPATPEAVILLILLLGGFTQALQFTAINALTFADIPPARMSAATSLHSMIQQISLGMGVALAATVLHASALWRGAGAGALIAADFRPAFWIIGMLSLIAAGIYLWLSPSAGADLGGPQPVRRHA
jgi:predicted MFS family arabinose efflux permease